MITQTITEKSVSAFLKDYQSNNLNFQKVANSANMLLFTQLLSIKVMKIHHAYW